MNLKNSESLFVNHPFVIFSFKIYLKILHMECNIVVSFKSKLNSFRICCPFEVLLITFLLLFFSRSLSFQLELSLSNFLITETFFWDLSICYPSSTEFVEKHFYCNFYHEDLNNCDVSYISKLCVDMPIILLRYV